MSKKKTREMHVGKFRKIVTDCESGEPIFSTAAPCSVRRLERSRQVFQVR